MKNPLQYSHDDLDRVNTDFHQGLVDAVETLAPYPIHWWTKEIEEEYKCKTAGGDILKTLRARLPQKTD
eukprot:10737397-Ditylum_brightwellii.AAC.1